MEYKKAGDIDYVDLKEACQTFNQQEHLLGTRINLRKKGFDVLMESFIRTVLAVPSNRWEYIPEEVMVFYRTLPEEYFKAFHIVKPPPDESAAEDDVRVTCLPQENERKSGRFLPKEGKIKVKATVGLMETIRQLEDLVAALKKARLFIASGKRMMMMKPGNSVHFKLGVSVRKDKKSLQEQMAITLEWVRENAIEGHEDKYVISSKGPENG